MNQEQGKNHVIGFMIDVLESLWADICLLKRRLIAENKGTSPCQVNRFSFIKIYTVVLGAISSPFARLSKSRTSHYQLTAQNNLSYATIVLLPVSDHLLTDFQDIRMVLYLQTQKRKLSKEPLPLNPKFRAM